MDAFGYSDVWGDLKTTFKKGVEGRISSVEKRGNKSGKETVYLPKRLSAWEGRRRQHEGLAELSRNLFFGKKVNFPICLKEMFFVYCVCMVSWGGRQPQKPFSNMVLLQMEPGWQWDPCHSGAGGGLCAEGPSGPGNVCNGASGLRDKPCWIKGSWEDSSRCWQKGCIAVWSPTLAAGSNLCFFTVKNTCCFWWGRIISSKITLFKVLKIFHAKQYSSCVHKNNSLFLY